MELFEHACIVVESTMMDVLTGDYKSGADPYAVFGMAMKIMVERKIPIYFCCNRAAAKIFTEQFLFKSVLKILEVE